MEIEWRDSDTLYFLPCVTGHTGWYSARPQSPEQLRGEAQSFDIQKGVSSTLLYS